MNDKSPRRAVQNSACKEKGGSLPVSSAVSSVGVSRRDRYVCYAEPVIENYPPCTILADLGVRGMLPTDTRHRVAQDRVARDHRQEGVKELTDGSGHRRGKNLFGRTPVRNNRR